MQKILAAAAALIMFPVTAFAQATDPQVGQIGLVTAAKLVPLNADAGIVWNRKEAGDACKLHQGDHFEIVGILADGSILAKRKLHVRLAKPSKDTCPTGALVKLGKPEAAAAVQAKVAADAAKAARRAH